MKKKIIRFLKVAIFCTVCVLYNACSCLIGNPGEDVYYQDVKVINKSGKRSMLQILCLGILLF